MGKFDGLFEQYLQYINFDGLTPDCQTVHPMVEKAFEELHNAEDFETLWRERFTDVEKQLRDCLATELCEVIHADLPEQVAQVIKPHLIPLLCYAVSVAWLVRDEVKTEFGE